MRFNIYAIRHTREAKGWTQGDLAYRCGWTVQRISQIESGKENLTMKTLEQVWRALGFSGDMSFFVEDGKGD